MPICFNSNADLSDLFALEAVSLGIISIELLLISFTANRTALIIDCPSSLFEPDNGTKRPIFIFSEALVENENNIEKLIGKSKEETSQTSSNQNKSLETSILGRIKKN